MTVLGADASETQRLLQQKVAIELRRGDMSRRSEKLI